MSEKRRIPDNVMQGIMKMFSCDNFWEELACFYMNYNDLKDCSFFIYSDNEGQELPTVFKTNYENDFAIIEIGFSDRYYAIDSKICKDMLMTGVAYYNLDICVELDTQAVSYLKKMFKSVDEVDIPSDKHELLIYLNRTDVNYSCLPYMVENAGKISKNNFEQIYLNLKSYELFKNFDYNSYIDAGIKKYKNDEANMQIETDELFACIQTEDFLYNMQDSYDMQETIFCLLIKAVLIEWDNSKKSAINKMRILIDYVNETLGVFCEREMAVCFYFFEHHKRTEKFFKKAKKECKEVESAINGMAWDLAHVRMLEKSYNLIVEDNIKFGIHPLLTYDNGLKDILSLYPIKKMAIFDGFTIPCFKNKFTDLVPDAIELLFDPEVVEKRRRTFERRNIEVIKDSLKAELNLLQSRALQ